MTRAAVARAAGATFLLYIAVKVAGSVLFEGPQPGGSAWRRPVIWIGLKREVV